MSDISIPGVSSKYNTPQLIENLMKVEKRKLQTFESTKTELNERKTTWQTINRKLGTIRESARLLYGFDNPFLNKLGSTTDPSALSVTASRQSQNGSWNLKILQMASADRFLSKELPLDFQVPPGTFEFTLGDKTIPLNFRGGKLNAFAEAINQRPEGLLKASIIKNTTQSQVLLIQAVPVGAKNTLHFNQAATELMNTLGVLGPNEAAQKVIQTDPLKLEPATSKTLTFDSPFKIKPGMVLEADVTITRLDQPPVPPPLPGLKLPDSGQVDFQGVVLLNDPLEAPLPQAPPAVAPKEITDFSFLRLQNSTGGVVLPELSDREGVQKVSIPLGSLLSESTGLELQNKNSQRSMEISHIVIRNPLETGEYKPLNPLSRAQDALLEMDGIKIQRSTNKLEDLVPGVTFNIEGTSEKPVTATVEPDLETVKNSIINLVGNYNQFLTDLLVYTTNNPAVIEESYLSDPKLAEQKKQALKDLGKFQGEITLNQMKSAFQRIFMDAYPTDDGSGINLLSQIGISTNASGGVGSRPDNSRLRGYLEINEGKLDQSLKENFDSVKKLFGRDTTGDMVVDRGVGYSLDEYIRPYTQLAGLITGKISTIDGQISQTDKKIRDYNVYLTQYEQDLKRKYGNMESSLNSMQKSFDNIDNFTRQNDGN